MAANIRQLVARPLRVAAWISGISAVIATPWAEEFIRTSDNWEFKVIVCLLGGLAVSAAWLCFPKDWLAQIEANLITGGSFVLFWSSVPVFLYWNAYLGHLLIVSSAIWDVLDGKAEIERKRRSLTRSRLNRWIGKWFDPLRDKSTTLPLLAFVSCRGIVNPWILAAVIAPDAIGTLLREPFTTVVNMFGYPSSMSWRERLNAEIDKSLKKDDEAAADAKNNKDESKANWIGKIKALVQCLGLEYCLPFLLGWITVSRHDFRPPFTMGWVVPVRYPDWIFAAAAVLGFLSVISRHLPPSRFMAWANSCFGHKEVL